MTHPAREGLVKLSQRHVKAYWKLQDQKKVVERLDKAFRAALVNAIATDDSILQDPFVMHHAIAYELHHTDPTVRQRLDEQLAKEPCLVLKDEHDLWDAALADSITHVRNAR